MRICIADFPESPLFVGVGAWGTGGKHRNIRGMVGEDFMMTTTSARGVEWILAVVVAFLLGQKGAQVGRERKTFQGPTFLYTLDLMA